MSEPIRILQVVNKMDRAGLETMLMNYYRNIDRSKVQFDFLTHREERGAYDDEIESLGGKIYRMPRLMPQNYPKYFKKMKSFFKEHPEYKIVHSHIDAMSSFPLRAAKKAGVKIRIAHSHNTKIDKDYRYLIKVAARSVITKYANTYMSCGEEAGKFLFKNKKFTVLNNAIDVKKFEYNEDSRKKVRRELNINVDSFVIGHVGRFTYVKNQTFLIDIFKKILETNPNSNLILIGMGPDEEMLKIKIQELNIEEKVKILINRADVNELYQAMDCFVMPSLFEGLPVVGVEAQASGLPCVFSKNISQEVLISSTSVMVPLNESVDEWCNVILNVGKKRNINAKEDVRKKKYDVKTEAETLMNMYLDFQKEEGIL